MASGWITCLALILWISLTEASGVPGKPSNLVVDTMSPSADHGLIATLRWSMPPSNSSLNYYVRYQETNSKRTVQKKSRKTNARMFLKPNSQYTVKVIAFDAKFPGMRGPWSDELKVRTGNSVPTHAPLNVTVTAIAPSSVLVKWSLIPKEHRNGRLLGYYVFFRNPSTKRWKTKKIANSLKFQFVITGLDKGESCIVAVAGYTKIGVGKKSNPVIVDRSLPTTRLLPTTLVLATVQQTTAQPSTTEMTTPKYVDNYIPKPTTKEVIVTYEMSVVHSETAPVHETETTVKSPNAQAKKDEKPKKRSSTTLVYKFIIPAVIGGLVLVLLIVCIMWRKRKFKLRHQGGDTISLTTLGETRKKEKSKCEVTRGEGSIRYAPPPKSYNGSAPPSQEAHDPQEDQNDETRTTLSVISETEPSKSVEENTNPQTEPSKARRPYAEVTIVGKDERYVKRKDSASAGFSEPNSNKPVTSSGYSEPNSNKPVTSSGYSEPNSNKPAPSSPAKSTGSSEGGYENMQHLYDFIDAKDEKGNPIYMNISTKEEEGEGLYEEIPADREENTDENDDKIAVQQPLLYNNQVYGENGKTAV